MSMLACQIMTLYFHSDIVVTRLLQILEVLSLLCLIITVCIGFGGHCMFIEQLFSKPVNLITSRHINC